MPTPARSRTPGMEWPRPLGWRRFLSEIDRRPVRVGRWGGAAFSTATVACCDLLERLLGQLALRGGKRKHEVTYVGRILDHPDVKPLREVEPRLFEHRPGIAHETRPVPLVTPRAGNDLADHGPVAGASLHRKPPVETGERLRSRTYTKPVIRSHAEPAAVYG